MESTTELFRQLLSQTTDNIYVQNPCKVEAVHNNYVDVLLYINDDEPDFVIYNVPIKHQETQRAYIFLGIKKGDRGVVRFFDRSTEGYLQSDIDYNSDERQHDINDRCFELGFVPDKESYVYPNDKEIVIGLKNQKFTLSVDDEGKLSITSQNNVDINITGNVTQTINGNIEQTITGDVTQNVSGDANITANNINSSGNLTHTGNVTINGTLTATTVIAQNGSTGTYANQVTTASGIVVSGS